MGILTKKITREEAIKELNGFGINIEYLSKANSILAEDLIWAEQRIMQNTENIGRDGLELSSYDNAQIANKMQLITIAQTCGIQQQNNKIIELLQEQNENSKKIVELLAQINDPEYYNEMSYLEESDSSEQSRSDEEER